MMLRIEQLQALSEEQTAIELAKVDHPMVVSFRAGIRNLPTSRLITQLIEYLNAPMPFTLRLAELTEDQFGDLSDDEQEAWFINSLAAMAAMYIEIDRRMPIPEAE